MKATRIMKGGAVPPATFTQADDPANVAEQVATSDLRTEICLRDYVRFYGTWQQLIDEGVLPADSSPPDLRRMHCGKFAGFSFSVFRIKPPGFKGPYRDWFRSGDYWQLTQRPIRPVGRDYSFDDLRVAQLKAEAQSKLVLVWWLTSSNPIAKQFKRRYRAAATDQAFQKLLGEWVKSSKAVAREMLA